MKMDALINKNYPDAKKSETFARQTIGRLKSEHGFIPEKTILAASLCSDEVVEISSHFCNHLAVETPFILGGLAGFPFTGITGIGAFASHVPDDGFAIILYGPHIGIPDEGELGWVRRIGQKKTSACCGALVASLNAVENGKAGSGDKIMDYQQRYLELELDRDSGQNPNEKISLKSVTDLMYKRTDQRIKALLERRAEDFKNRSVALVGGIVLNTDFGLPDWFELREFSVHKF